MDPAAESTPSSQVESAAIRSDSLALLSQLLNPESTRLGRDGLQVDGSQPEVTDTQDDQDILTTTSTAGNEAAIHTMDVNSPAVPASSTSPAYTGASWDCLRDVIEPLACGKAFYFDSRGDLVLKVGAAFHEGGQEFFVCSRTVARWSKVFNAMFFGGFAESIPSSCDGTWTVALPEDRIAPIFLVLAIIHGPHQTVPMVLGRDELFELLTVTEKYDMTHILRPWATRWIQNLPLDNSDNATGEHRDLWISWELGYEAGFCKILKDILWNCRLDDAGQLLDVRGVPLKTIPCQDPSSIIEIISIKRAELIEGMIGLLRRTVQTAFAGGCCLGGDPDGKRYEMDNVPENPYKSISREECEDLFFGNLVRRIRELGVEAFVLPPAASSSYLGSAYDLRYLIEFHDSNGYIDGHDSCDPWIDVQSGVREMFEQMPSPITEKHFEYLRNQAKKTGV